MVKFIEATDLNNYPVLINIEDISIIYKDKMDEENTYISFRSGANLIVKESIKTLSVRIGVDNE